MDTPDVKPDDTTTYEPLDNEFRADGFELKLVKREGDFAIYSKGRGDKIYGYEVIKVKKNKGGEMFGKMIPPREGYPSNEAFGTWGWYFPDLEHAQARFDRLTGKFGSAGQTATDEAIKVEVEATLVVEGMLSATDTDCAGS